MIWENTFYTIKQLSTKEDGIRATVEIMEKHPIFKGHFPNEPIVPGVCTLAMIRKCLRIYYRRDLSFMKIKECKFISVVQPEAGLTLSIDIIFLKDSAISAIVSHSEKTVIKLKATIQ